MSTKTTFKRIALVAVAALGFGMISVAPSNADTYASNAVAVAATTKVLTTAPTAGETVSVLVNLTGFFLANSGVSDHKIGYQVVTAGWGAVPAKSTTSANPVLRGTTSAERTALGLTAYGPKTGSAVTQIKDSAVADGNGATTDNAQTIAVTNNAGVTVGDGAGSYSQYAIATFIPDVAGTWGLTFVDPDRATYYVYTVNVTVAAKADTSATASTIALTAAADGYATLAADGTTVLGVSGSKTAGKTVGTATLTLANGSTSALLAADAPKITATVTGPGLVSWAGGSTGKSVVSAGAQLSPVLTIYSDGASGDGKVTFTYTNAAGTVVEIGSKTVSFFGSVATIKTTLYHTVVPVGLFSSPGSLISTSVVRAIPYDSNGTIVKGASLYMTSGNQGIVAANVLAPTTACSGSSGKCYWKTTGVAAGTTTLTIVTGADATATGYVSQAVGSVRVGSTTAKSIKIEFDKSDYVPGELATISVTALDADGLVVADGSTTAFYAGYEGLSSDNFAFTSGGADLKTATDSTIVIDGGKASFNVNMPMSSGTLYVSGVGAATLATAQAAQVIASNKVTISADNSVAQAAADAAAEATDAANAATDAANAAAEAADAATAAAQDAADAVAALSTSVTAMVDALKKQITALTNLVIKIQKKVKA